MSQNGVSLEASERAKRVILRSLSKLRVELDTALQENPSEECAHKIAAVLETFNSNLSELKEITNEILDTMDTSNLEVAQISANEAKVLYEFDDLQLYYSIAKGKMNAMFARLNRGIEPQIRRTINSSLVGESSPMNPLVKLPDIPVPKFDGKLKNFTEWHSLFEAMIDSNENLKPIQKLYYLKQAMIGEAQHLLKDYQIQEGIYETAWKFVKERYFNKRVIIASHFRDLLDLPSITYTSLRESLDKVNAIIRGLKVCDLDVEKMSPLIAYVVVHKLPERLRTDWENSNPDYSTYPSFSSLATFLQNRCFSYESIHSEAQEKTTKSPISDEKKKPKSSSLVTGTKIKASMPSSSLRCFQCGQGHYLTQCSQFLEKSVSDRYALIREKKLCVNCLRQYHTAVDCNFSKCRKCSRAHHTLLHREIISSSPANIVPKSDPVKGAPVETKSSLIVVAQSYNIILLPSAVVYALIGPKVVKVRVLLDSCSQVNLVAESFVKQHRIASYQSSSTISGVSPDDFKSFATAVLKLKSRFGNFQLDLQADIVGRIPYEVNTDVMKTVKGIDINLPLADCTLPSSKVDILIGGEFANRILLGNKKFIGNLCFEESLFGWVAEGLLSSIPSVDSRCCHLTVKVEEALEKFWEVEEVDSPKHTLSEYEVCEAHFESSHTRLADGRFSIRLPLKKPVSELADNFQQARAALSRFESKCDNSITQLYRDFMKEYHSLGHMELVPKSSNIRYFIPHLPVLRPESSTTKLRVVFNASAKNNSGISLNEILMTGPTIQPELFDILLKFRTYPIAFSADISKMYRQISVHPDDRYLQTILWRDQPNESIQQFQLATLTYGTTPASFVATKCLQVLAKEVESVHPEVAHAICAEFYMDDLLTGANSIEEAKQKSKMIQEVLQGAQFPLRKYVSNSTEFLKSLDPALLEELTPLQFSSTGSAKILGLQWQPESDYFSINVKAVQIDNVVLTKRSISSLAARIYDPLGLAAPVTIKAKILLQDLWREGKAWDDPASSEISEQFRAYYSELSLLLKFRVPRFYFCGKPSEFNLVGFCDASQRAYGAVIYICGNGYSSLVCSKTKVAPVKALTVPRLELLGAVLLVKLLVRLSKVLKYDISKVKVFCDSTIVLAWLKGPSFNYQVFVRNRVEFVNSVIPFEQWNYVRTSENPADLVTRGVSVNSLVENSFWLHGPIWLLKTNELIPLSYTFPEDVPEKRSVCNVNVIEDFSNEHILSRFSDFDKLIRVMSYVCKFLVKVYPQLDIFQITDTRTQSINLLCRISQLTFFMAEIMAMKQNKALPARSVLLSLDPLIDSYGILRVGGRLRSSNLSYNAKHPIILSRKSHLAELLVRHIHVKYFHASRAFTLAFLQSKFWIIGGAPKLVKKVINCCVWCTRAKGESLQQIMGDLPYERTEASRPFAFSGVDFAGPIEVKCTNHRSQKHINYYIAFFVCLTTRATHLEVVSDLSTIAFIASLQRFCARRGIPNTIWSDNGTNFVGAVNILEKHCMSTGLRWKFISPRSPHQGGVWESAVKAGKKYLLAATKGHVMNVEELTTLLAQVEAILNSRPLYRKGASADPDVIDVITPGHFLVGSCLLDGAVPPTLEVSLTEQLALHRIVLRSFWLQWSKSYIGQQQSKAKWKTRQSNVEVGDVVLLKDERRPSYEWPLGRVVDVFPDKSGKVRNVSLKSKGSVFQRSIQKLVKIPVEL